jgi:hypothetical protein
MKTERFNGNYCGEPKPPTPPTPPPAPTPPLPAIPLASIGGSWMQGKEPCQIHVDAAQMSVSISHKGDACCKWDGGSGSVTANGRTITVDATGPGGFATAQRGDVTTDGKLLSVKWTNTGGQAKTWASWTKAV